MKAFDTPEPDEPEEAPETAVDKMFGVEYVQCDAPWQVLTYTADPFDDALEQAAGEVDHREALVDAQRMGAVIGAYMAEVMKQIPLPAALPLALQYQGSLLHPTAVIHLTGDDDDEDDYAGSF